MNATYSGDLGHLASGPSLLHLPFPACIHCIERHAIAIILKSGHR